MTIGSRTLRLRRLITALFVVYLGVPTWIVLWKLAVPGGGMFGFALVEIVHRR